ncbi:hypothetical protein [Sphingobium amiense]|uniref:hypothetical protein n=1 Tax=Sphingobium amiense TaxID=135719 RepID=UPI000833F12A|nr:hypothetical protein [Sphingobium amiense]
MAKSYPDFALTGQWQDIAVATGYTAIANERVMLQSKSRDAVLMFIGGASAPSADDGIAVSLGKALSGTSDHFWVKGSGEVAVLVED